MNSANRDAMTFPLTTAIVLAHNSSGTLQRCLDSFLTNGSQASFIHRVIIVENGSTDESRSIVQRFCKNHPFAEAILCERNLGTTATRNKAIKRVKTEQILLLDSDAYVTPEVVAILTDRLQEDSKIGIVSPRLQYANGRYQLSVDRFPTLLRKLQRYFFLRSLEVERYSETACVDYSISAAWLVRKQTFDEIGMFDEQIFFGPEDVELCMRLWKAGYKVVYEPSAVMIHDAQELSRSWIPNKYTFIHLRGLIRYFVKHRYILHVGRVKRKYKIPKND